MKAIYFDAIRELQTKGVNFEKDVFTLSSSDRSQLEEAARKYGYRRPKPHISRVVVLSSSVCKNCTTVRTNNREGAIWVQS